MHVLVVEDEPTSAKLVHVILSEDGIEVEEVDAAEKVFAAIKKDKPDAILMDLALPGMDGLSLTRKLKNDPETMNIPVIAITAYPNRWTRDDAMKAGCDAYIVKPIDTRQLSGEVEKAVRKKSKKAA